MPECLQPSATTEALRIDEEEHKRLTERQWFYYDCRARDWPQLAVGDHVWVHPGSVGGKINVKGEIYAEQKEPRSFDVQPKSGSILRRNREELTASRFTDAEQRGEEPAELVCNKHKQESREVKSEEATATTDGYKRGVLSQNTRRRQKQSRPPSYLSDYVWSTR